MFSLHQAYGGANPPSIWFVCALARLQKIGRGLGAVLAILLAMVAYIPEASAAHRPSSFGCKDAAPSCQLPANDANLIVELVDGDWTGLVKLPRVGGEYNSVTVHNKASTPTKVAVDGSNGDGVPLKKNQSLLFHYKPVVNGEWQWNVWTDEGKEISYSYFGTNPVPSFNGGGVTLSVDPQNNSSMSYPINLPTNPANGSTYSTKLVHINPQPVVINTGSGNVTLSASRQSLMFIADGGKWSYTALPSDLGCKDAAPVCQLPSGYSKYNFELVDYNWTKVVKLPQAPREGDSVSVLNKADTTTRVAVDGSNGDGIPLTSGAKHTFTYKNSRWNSAYLHISVLPGSSTSEPFLLPSFNGGSIYLDLSYNSPSRVILPASPQTVSFYSFGMNTNVTNSVVVQQMQTAGSGDVTLSASRTGASFVVSDGKKWDLLSSGTPSSLGCSVGHSYCQLPSGIGYYELVMSEDDWVLNLILPANPRLGDIVVLYSNGPSNIKETRVGVSSFTDLSVPHGTRMMFTYKKQLGEAIWEANAQNEQAAYCSNPGAPCALPKFTKGMVKMQISSDGANRFDLPLQPATGSIYELTAKTPVWINPGSGTVQMAQGKTHLFQVVNNKWEHQTILDLTPSDLGCQSATSCLLPNGFDTINMVVSDINNTRHVQLPSSGSEGDRVLIENQQSGQSVQVSVTGMDGVQVDPGKSQTFVFQKTPLGVVQWTTSGHLDQICPVDTLCSLPTFSNGYLQYSGTSAITSKVRLPTIYDMNPTGIELFMASDATNQISVENGGGLFTLSAAENPQLVFKSEYTEWRPVLKNSPSQLNCNNSNVCVLPNGNSNYVFELSNRDRVPQIKLPANPVMQQEVLIKNHSTEPTYVSVTGTSGDGLAVAGGSQLRFTYRQSDAKLTQWVADKVRVTHCSMNTGVACELHSFNKGYAHIDLTGVFNSGFILPRSPQAGSIYVISNNNDDGWQTSITGTGTTVLRAKELRQFFVKDGAWNYDRAQNGFDPQYHQVKELVVLHDTVNSTAAEVYANGNMRTPVTVMVKVVDSFTQKAVDIYNTPGLVKFYDHTVGTGTNRNAWIIPDENPVGDNYMVGWQAFTKQNDFDSLLSYSARDAVVTAESQIAAMSRSGDIDEYSRFNLYVSTTKSALKNLCVRFGTSTVYRDSCADGPNTTNKASVRGILPVIRNGSDFNIIKSRGTTQDHAVAWTLMFVPNHQNGRFRVHSVTSKPVTSHYFGSYNNNSETMEFHPNKWQWNDNDWGLIDMRPSSRDSGSRALYLKSFGVIERRWGGHTEKAYGKERSFTYFNDDPNTKDGNLYMGAMQGGECGERDQRSVYNSKLIYTISDNKGGIEFLDNYGNPGRISFLPDSERCGIYTFS